MNPNDQVVSQFAVLHAGRSDAWGAVEGRCVYEPLTLDVWRQHLYGRGSVGVYPLVDDHVMWGCVDIDQGYDMLVIARNIRSVLARLGINCWVERTKGKGWHAWSYATDWTPADDMRRALMVACQVAGYDAKEVNPKQVSAADLGRGLGNYVNASYARTYADMGKRVMVDLDVRTLDGIPPTIPLGVFVERAWADRTQPAVYAQAAQLYKPPVRQHVDVPDWEDWDPENSTVPELVQRQLSGLAWTIFRDGPLDGRDRSGTLMRLAYLSRESGLSAADTLKVVADMDRRCGRKFADRADGLERLQEMVVRAYSKQMEPRT